MHEKIENDDPVVAIANDPNMKSVRCKCGQYLGRFDHKLDRQCHKCKLIVLGDVVTDTFFFLKVRPKLPRDMLDVK